jgi:DNA-binding NtrC family response regulator
MRRVLIVDDQYEEFKELFREVGNENGYNVNIFGRPMEAMIAIPRLKYDVAFIDRSFFGESVSGDDLMELSKENYPDVPVVCISGYGDKPKYADYVLTKPIAETKRLFEFADEILKSNSKQF